MDYNSSSFLTAAQVSERVNSMSAFYNIKNDAFVERLRARLDKLYALKSQFLSLEQAAYTKLGYSDLSKLQEKIDEINGSGIKNFSARVLATMPAMREAKDNLLTKEQRVEIINQEIEKAVQGKHSIFSPAIEALKEDYVDLSQFSINELVYMAIEKKAASVHSATNMSKKDFKKQFNFSGKTLKLNKMSSTYSKAFNLIVSESRGADQAEYTGYNIDVQWVEEGKVDTLNYYPYYALTPEQQTQALSDTTTWENFKRKISGLAPQYSLQISQFMEQIGKQPFFAASPANIQGIMGELGAMVMLSVLAPGMPVFYTGDKLNQYDSFKGQQLGVDLFLDDIGFQVKNYGGYGVGSSPTGINLKGSYTLDNFANKIEGSGFDIKEIEVLSKFHISVSQGFSGIREVLDQLQNNLDALYSASIYNFMPFEQQVQLLNDDQTLTEVQTHRNLFYLIGGTKIVPTSNIINAYYIQLQRVLDQAKNAQAGMGSTFSVKSAYSGYTYANYENKDLPTGFTYQDVANGITMNYRINLHIPYLQDLIMKS